MTEDHAPSLEGILVGIDSGHYRIARPTLIETLERSHELAGEVWVERRKVLFLQVLP